MNRTRLARQQEQSHGLGFVPQDAVRWLAPRELARAAVKALLAAVFADYADKREIQAGLEQGLIELGTAVPGSSEDVWIDYVADLGDGFDATFTVASLLAQDCLTPAGTELELPRGRLLVLGGDEVYPTASAEAYEDRMTGPYRAAFPYAFPQPLMLALPGNHDWYDGLTSFLRIFTHGRSIGGWRTVQSRSYFAARLPHKWWLIGLDSQFETYIDEPQLKYFENQVTNHLEPGDGVILCSASPTWQKSCEGDPDAFNSLFWFERNYIRGRRKPGSEVREPTGAEVRLWLTGDNHHYARYVETLAGDGARPGAARQMVTCGLGGAFLSATHNLPREVQILHPQSRSLNRGDTVSDFTRVGTTYPPEEESRVMARNLALPWRPGWLLTRNPGLFPLIAGVHLAVFIVLLLLFGQGSIASYDEHGRVVASYIGASTAQMTAFAVKIGTACLVAALLVWALPLFRLRRPVAPVGVLAALLVQVGVALGVFAAVRTVAFDWLGLDGGADAVILAVTALLAGGLGGLVGGTVLGVMIVVARSGAPLLWQMSGQAIEDGKGFLRIKLAADGTLTVHPLVVGRVVRDWSIRPVAFPTDPTTGALGAPIQVPQASQGLPTMRLIEEPFTIARSSS